MARGNFINRVQILKKNNIIEVTSEDSFRYYRELKISKAGTLIGYWCEYRDYITTKLPKGTKIIKREDFKITLKIEQQ